MYLLFTIRTEIELWVCFSGLAATLFLNRLPEVFRYAIQPILVAGAILSVAFAILFVRVMAFVLFIFRTGFEHLVSNNPIYALITFLFGVLGLSVVYIPIIPLIAFVLSARKIHNSVTEKRISTGLIGGTIVIILSYSILYKIEWDRARTFFYEESLRIEKLDEQEVSAGRRPRYNDIRSTQYLRHAETFRWILNGEQQCERFGISEEACPFVNSLLSVEKW
ncbi:hypothetical protein LEP1GSC043_0436 [Leptospira weilii str. Ecochallenge]|uniref:Uncharacterized protein n=1 Tax=Leptospira weilii str. Ecochallenge TaxID=1049986 RepID=N1UAC6_9LEPT|nr:hypothetical protein LEP1GSC043_0436 [Leptospira weilii str. Ecochallenge]